MLLHTHTHITIPYKQRERFVIKSTGSGINGKLESSQIKWKASNDSGRVNGLASRQVEIMFQFEGKDVVY